MTQITATVFNEGQEDEKVAMDVNVVNRINLSGNVVIDESTLAKEHIWQGSYTQANFTNNALTGLNGTNLDIYNYSANPLTFTLKKSGSLVASFTLQPQGNSGDALTKETFPAFDEIDVSEINPNFAVIVRS